jgi:hypothetical protein
VDARFGLFGDSANLVARLVHGLHRTYHRLRNRLTHLIDLLCDIGHVESRFNPFGNSSSVSVT